MDAGALGGIIGIGVMVLLGTCLKLYDVMEKRKNKISMTTPLLVSQPSTVIRPPTHWKVNDLFKNQKKTILLKNLNSMSANRNLTTISIKN